MTTLGTEYGETDAGPDVLLVVKTAALHWLAFSRTHLQSFCRDPWKFSGKLDPHSKAQTSLSYFRSFPPSV